MLEEHSSKVKDLLEKANSIALFGHKNIDGDCIGSMLGLGNLLEKQGKKVRYFTPEPAGESMQFIIKEKKIETEFDYGEYEILVFLDFSGYDRIQKFTHKNTEYFDTHKLIVIDHHQSDTPQTADYIIKNKNVTSCCEICFEHCYTWWPKLFDKDIANCFYLGITTDSGNFMYDWQYNAPHSSINIFKTASKLIELGANKQRILDNIYYDKSIQSVHFLSTMLSRMKQENNILYSYYDLDELTEKGLDQEDVKQSFISIFTKIKGPQIYLIISKRNNTVNGSLRLGKIENNKKTNCNEIASVCYNGGGHIAAAGFHLPYNGNFEQQRKDILEKIGKYLEK